MRPARVSYSFIYKTIDEFIFKYWLKEKYVRFYTKIMINKMSNINHFISSSFLCPLKVFRNFLQINSKDFLFYRASFFIVIRLSISFTSFKFLNFIWFMSTQYKNKSFDTPSNSFDPNFPSLDTHIHQVVAARTHTIPCIRFPFPSQFSVRPISANTLHMYVEYSAVWPPRKSRRAFGKHCRFRRIDTRFGFVY